MAEPFLAEIRIFSFNFAPKGWAMANGQLLPINQNQALFSLLGTTYGGDGRVTFALPDLRGRLPGHIGAQFVQGQSLGAQNQTLTAAEMPSHTHPAACNTGAGTLAGPGGNYWAADSNGEVMYAATPSGVLGTNILARAGGSQAHNNLMPFLALNFCIALQGIFPSRP
jgi:microcystin-dependent protein